MKTAPVLVAALAIASPAFGSTIMVDFGDGPPTAAGFVDYIAGDRDEPSAVAAEYLTPFTVSVDIDGFNLPQGNDDFRVVDRGAGDDYTRDWIGVDARGYMPGAAAPTMRLTLDLLNPGRYEFVSTHHDGGPTNGNQTGLLNYELSDARGITTGQVDVSAEMAGDPVSTLMLSILSDGGPITLSFVPDAFADPNVGTMAASFTVMNGFTLTRIPEPSVGLLGCLGLIGLLRRRR